MKQETGQTYVVKMLTLGVATILVLMPVHAFFTAWAASNFGHFDLIRVWKELLIAVLALGAAWIIYKDKELAKSFIKNRLVQIILVYILLQLGLGLVAFARDQVNLNALLYGWIINLRFLVFFLVALIAASKTSLKDRWQKLLFWPAAAVVGFGLVQQFLLPPDFLKHFGYGPDTLLPYQAVDLKTAYIRLQSTLRGPNPLGVYLILIVTALLGVVVKQKKKNHYAWLLSGLVLALYFTYSRSAWIGVFVSVVILLWLYVNNQKVRQVILVASAALVVLSSVAVILLRDNDHVQNIFFHTDEHSTSSVSSNFDRASALKNGLKDTLSEPLGRGPGTAGPASLRNNHSPRVAESYYLQIGQEVGAVGLLLFIVINIYVVLYLYKQRKDTLSMVLLASFIGISVTNLLSHAWADDTISLIWWGLAGLALAPAILNKKRKHNNVWTKEKTTA
ncbi:hypothetical protein A3D14_00655 [Candidatus Saccharibacteria bacterium RIFCSPHIGHO2_02_FULL_47_12]|nr:MAG: hypothetical protein A3D14_00655 [Candidatus Saccharibacteria bacterium RIFCSPHIGHO2_02_FULL_47_12]